MQLYSNICTIFKLCSALDNTLDKGKIINTILSSKPPPGLKKQRLESIEYFQLQIFQTKISLSFSQLYLRGQAPGSAKLNVFLLLSAASFFQTI